MTSQTYPITRDNCRGIHDPHGHYRPCSGESAVGAGDEDDDGGEWTAVSFAPVALRWVGYAALAGAATWAVCWMVGAC